MNSEHLSHIVQQPERITGQDALELEELCRKFPAFPTPFILLARYYQQTGDYRAEEAIQNAALRVTDRAWLSDFVLNQSEEPVTAEETALPEEEPLAETTPADDIPAETHSLEQVAEISEVEAVEAVDSENPATEEPVWVVEEVMITEEITTEETEPFSVSTLFIPEDPEESVFEEIETFETGNEASILGFSPAALNETENYTVEMGSDGTVDAGGLILPFTEPEVEESDTLAEKVEVTKPVIGVFASYQIEQYFPSIEPENNGKPTDFYSWLNNPVAASDEDKPAVEDLQESENHRLQQQSIIDKFIQSDPGVIRPKKEFFTPETAAKKSENLPENLATETLAKVYLQQGNTEGAILIYERLMLKFPEKNTYFADLIQKIIQENNP